MGRKPLETGRCPKGRELEAYARKTLYGTRSEQIYLHLKHCAACLRRMAKIRQVPTASEIIQGGQRKRWWERLLGVFQNPTKAP